MMVDTEATMFYSDLSENAIRTTKPQGKPACQTPRRSLQYFLRSSGNKLKLSKSMIATYKLPQGKHMCQISLKSLQYFLKISVNKL